MKSKINFLLYLIITLVVVGCKGKRESEKIEENVISTDRIVGFKDETELQSTWDKLEEKIDEDPDLLYNMKQIYNRDLHANPPSSTQVALKQLNQLLYDPNSNPSASSSTLKLFVKIGATDLVRESLLNPRRDVTGWGLVITASKAIATTKDEKALPNLIYALTKNNYPQEGSEDATIHAIMKRKLIEAIKAITGLDIDVNKINVNDPQQVENVLSMARDWAQKNDIKLLD